MIRNRPHVRPTDGRKSIRSYSIPVTSRNWILRHEPVREQDRSNCGIISIDNDTAVEFYAIVPERVNIKIPN
jgi:hypothetical protein